MSMLGDIFIPLFYRKKCRVKIEKIIFLIMSFITLHFCLNSF